MTAVLLALAFSLPTQAPQARPPPAPLPVYAAKVGDYAFIVSRSDYLEAISSPLIEPVESSFHEFDRYSKADDSEAFDRMVAEKRVLFAKPGTRAQVLAVMKSLSDDGYYGVLVKPLEGPMKDRQAIVPISHLNDRLPTIPRMSFERYVDMKTTAEKQRIAREVMRVRNGLAIRRDQARVQAAIIAGEQRRAADAARQAEYVRQHTPDYVSVTRDGAGKISSIYTHTPSGSSSFRTPTGSSSSEVFTRP